MRQRDKKEEKERKEGKKKVHRTPLLRETTSPGGRHLEPV